jgi:hypothetical protein
MKNPASTKNAEEADIYLMTRIGFDMERSFLLFKVLLPNVLTHKHDIKTTPAATI